MTPAHPSLALTPFFVVAHEERPHATREVLVCHCLQRPIGRHTGLLFQHSMRTCCCPKDKAQGAGPEPDGEDVSVLSRQRSILSRAHSSALRSHPVTHLRCPSLERAPWELAGYLCSKQASLHMSKALGSMTRRTHTWEGGPGGRFLRESQTASRTSAIATTAAMRVQSAMLMVGSRDLGTQERSAPLLSRKTDTPKAGHFMLALTKAALLHTPID